jgi:hypothetical protein
MKWKVRGRRTLYESEWVNLTLEDVEVAQGRRFDHHVIRMPRQSVAVVVRVWWPGCATTQPPRACAARRRGEGKSVRDIRRCLKRATARQLFKLLERCDARPWNCYGSAESTWPG